MTTADKIADAIKDMSDVEMLEYAATHFISQVDAIQRAGADPAEWNQLASRLWTLSKELKAHAQPDDE